MSLLKDAFNWIKDHGQFQTTEVHGRTVSDRDLHAIKAPIGKRVESPHAHSTRRVHQE